MNKTDNQRTWHRRHLDLKEDQVLTRVGRIGYLNVDPIYYGLENGLKPPWIQLTADPPSSLNRLMAQGELDISPVSTGAYARHFDEWLILPNLSISCQGPVMSVLLASRLPLDELNDRRILITSESGTAVLLLKLIFALKGVHPRTQTGQVDTAINSADTFDAVMIIGDKALSGTWGRQFEYHMDLGDEWFQLSGLPVVFAVWAVRREFAVRHPKQVRKVISLFKESSQVGKNHMGDIISAGAHRLHLDKEKVQAYFGAMQYDLGEKKQQALAAFFEGLHKHGLIEAAAPLAFFA